jgi:hypothetical protein
MSAGMQTPKLQQKGEEIVFTFKAVKEKSISATLGKGCNTRSIYVVEARLIGYQHHLPQASTSFADHVSTSNLPCHQNAGCNTRISWRSIFLKRNAIHSFQSRQHGCAFSFVEDWPCSP